MSNTYIILKSSETLRPLYLKRVSDVVTSQKTVLINWLWIDEETSTLIDFELYHLLDNIQKNEKILIEDIRYTVISLKK